MFLLYHINKFLWSRHHNFICNATQFDGGSHRNQKNTAADSGGLGKDETRLGFVSSPVVGNLGGVQICETECELGSQQVDEAFCESERKY